MTPRSEEFKAAISAIRERIATAKRRAMHSVKKLHGFGGVAEADGVIAELKEKYPRRLAMIEELTP